MAENRIEALISVSSDLASAKANLLLANNHPQVKAAFGYHPEQALPTVGEIKQLHQFIEINQTKMIAIGEVGLPYYLKQKNPSLDLTPYIELVEDFIILAKRYNKPIILHAIYEDAEVICDLLERHNVNQAHFHWFKGRQEITERIARNGYFISITPDVLYIERIRRIVEFFPLEQLMVETDGPWEFKGRFESSFTHPKMLHHVIDQIALIKHETRAKIYDVIYQNTVKFYKLQ